MIDRIAGILFVGTFVGAFFVGASFVGAFFVGAFFVWAFFVGAFFVGAFFVLAVIGIVKLLSNEIMGLTTLEQKTASKYIT